MAEAGKMRGKAGRRRHETRVLLRVHCTHQCRAARLQMPPIAQHRVTRQTYFGCDVGGRAVKGGEERGAVEDEALSIMCAWQERWLVQSPETRYVKIKRCT